MGLIDTKFLSYTSLNKNRIASIVEEVNSLAEKYASFSDEELSFMTSKFRKDLRTDKTIEDIMPDALAVVREAIRRKLGMFPYDVQIEAAASMSDNIIAQMKTGEGKTLVQMLSSYLYALDATKSLDRNEWGSVHILTSNEYLAQRDKNDNEKVFELLGLSCGYAEEKSHSKDKKYRENKVKAYNSDIVYGTAKTVAFDYLDDNHVKDSRRKFINRKLYHAIIDEADDILLDQAINPLVLSGSIPGLHAQDDINTQKLYKWATDFINGANGVRNKPVTCKVCDQYKKDSYDAFSEDAIFFKDESRIFLTERLYKEIYGSNANIENISVQEEMFLKETAITNALLAKYSYEKNKQYILEKDNDEYYTVSLVSENTGRVMKKTKYRDGMQEAIEAKEEFLADGYHITKTKTTVDIAKCTYPDFLSLYETGISGMTGTSDIEEFKNIYGLETYEVPKKEKSKRQDEETEIYVSKKAKYLAIIKEIIKTNRTGQPILLGTTNVIESNEFCGILDKIGLKYQRLDAVNSENEDVIKENAGKLGMITIATNMAGRGIDIKLSEGVREVGGLYVIGTSKNKNKRIDEQLRGRCARQADPGKTKFYQSLDDELVKIRYGSFKLQFFKELNKDSKEKITDKKIISIVDKCQESEEGHNKDMRKFTEEMDSKTFTVHKNKMYEQRNKILNASYGDLVIMLRKMICDYTDYLMKHPDELYKISHLIDVRSCYNQSEEKFRNNIIYALSKKFHDAPSMNTPLDYLNDLRKRLLDTIDVYWISHMENLQELKNTAVNYSYSKENPVEKYENMANKSFVSMTPYIQNEMITYALCPNIPFGMYNIPSEEIIESEGMSL